MTGHSFYLLLGNMYFFYLVSIKFTFHFPLLPFLLTFKSCIDFSVIAHS